MAVRVALILLGYLIGAQCAQHGIAEMFGHASGLLAYGVLFIGLAALYGYLTAPRRPL